MRDEGSPSPYRILQRKRRGETLDRTAIEAVVRGAADGTWTDAQLAAFLMAVSIRGLEDAETRVLTQSMAESGEQWNLASTIPGVLDKHSTGGVGDKVSIILAAVLAACDFRFAKLTGRGLGHTGGTADKLESIPGLRLEIDRKRCLALLDKTNIAIGVASAAIAPADRRLYSLRNHTATAECLPLIASSILSKKLALGPEALVLDVKTGNGAFLPSSEDSLQLAHLLVRTCEGLGRKATAIVTDMSQPLGSWAGHSAEIKEVFDCLEGRGDDRLVEVVLSLAAELSHLSGRSLADAGRVALSSGRALECFRGWAAAQGANRAWLARPDFQLAPVELVAEAPHTGILAQVKTRALGMLLLRAGGGRRNGEDRVDPTVSLNYRARLGEEVEAGQELARLYVPEGKEGLMEVFRSCFLVAESASSPRLIQQVVRGGDELDRGNRISPS